MNIEEARKEIDKIDGELLKLFEKRMSLSAEIAEEKKEKNLPVFNPKREEEIIKKIGEKSSPEFRKYTEDLYGKIFELSKDYQKELMK